MLEEDVGFDAKSFVENLCNYTFDCLGNKFGLSFFHKELNTGAI
jgi:hypothetical protein